MNGNGTNQETPSEAAQGITAITVRGFKSLRDETRLEIRPLTLLAGANSSGKSSAMQPLLLMKQTLEADYEPDVLLLDGPNTRFTSVEQILSKTDVISDGSFSIALESKSQYSIFTEFRLNNVGKFEIKQTTYTRNGATETLRPGLEQVQSTTSVESNEGVLTSKVIRRSISDRGFLRWASYVVGRDGEEAVPIGFAPSGQYLFQALIRLILHLPGLRGNPERTYNTSSIRGNYEGVFQNYVASLIASWQLDNDPHLTQLTRSLSALGLTNSVGTIQLDSTRVELRVSRLLHGSNDVENMVNIADVGFGVSQTLPVLVALLVAKPGQLVYIEQPELHLHPRAQTALAQVLVDAANRGVRVVAETHSSLLLLGVQTAVAEGKIAPDKVKLHWFQRGEDGFSKVTSADLDESGTFGDWPEDFADVELHAQSRFLDAAEARMGLR